jgi:hypothetical protein
MPELKRFSLAKPTLQTKFRIDFAWWQQNDRDWHIHLAGFLCPEHQRIFESILPGQMVDFVDPQTAEVLRVDGIQHTLISHCARQEGFIPEHASLVDAVFRIFLSNGNSPLNPVEIGATLNRPPETILRMLTGHTIYRGLRPCPDC